MKYDFIVTQHLTQHLTQRRSSSSFHQLRHRPMGTTDQSSVNCFALCRSSPPGTVGRLRSSLPLGFQQPPAPPLPWLSIPPSLPLPLTAWLVGFVTQRWACDAGPTRLNQLGGYEYWLDTFPCLPTDPHFGIPLYTQRRLSLTTITITAVSCRFVSCSRDVRLNVCMASHL
ncbi:uncharacterized protein BO88DRAFT_85556 [Aspergillus vadensis CBS 113365]|uniref:Uncharacterized protein n=1 Tax=Aspergillus vadensis (strain CBS 113365 / IMI 142717 / IBT 24658) TaxID=1448311 RepID=A0A319B382_ASPVC|nr:hypothetical protein BO88DRAFT_85556 [Aspergillus vadensis CBS 113365]PYH67207.1 hypothetical protein BO88DRAFT_85556 [Aspergillus vadensis CBS 113365]